MVRFLFLSALTLGLLAGCVSSKYIESPKAPTSEPVYEDEADVVQYQTTKQLGEAHPHLVIDGKKVDYDKDLEWFVYPGTKTKAYWLEPAVYEANTVPDRVLVPTGPDGNPVLDPTAGLAITRVWNDSTKWWDKPDGKGGFRPWDPEHDGDAPPPPPVIDDKVTQVDDEENVWHVLKPVLVATRPESVPNVFANPTPDERKIQTDRRKQGKLIWLYPTTQLKLLESSEFAGFKYREFSLVAAVLDADANGDPIDIYRVYITNEVLMQPELFKMGPPGPVEAAAAPADPGVISPADLKPGLRKTSPPSPAAFTGAEVELTPDGGVIEISSGNNDPNIRDILDPQERIAAVLKTASDELQKEVLNAVAGTRSLAIGQSYPLNVDKLSNGAKQLILKANWPKVILDGVEMEYSFKRKEYFDALYGIRLILFANSVPEYTDYRWHDEPSKNKDGDIRFVHRAKAMQIMEGGEWRDVKTGDTIAAKQAAFMPVKPDERACHIGQSRVCLTTTNAPEGRYRIVLETK